MTQSPYILYSDGKGNIFEDNSLYSTGRSGWDALPVPTEDWIGLPDGGSLYELPGRRGIGIDTRTGEMRLCDKGWAVAAFIPPAYTGLYLAAYESGKDAPTLPLFCYTAAGWLDGKIVVPAIRIEQDIRQDGKGYDWDVINKGVDSRSLDAYPHNRLNFGTWRKNAVSPIIVPPQGIFLWGDGNAPCPLPLPAMPIV